MKKTFCHQSTQQSILVATPWEHVFNRDEHQKQQRKRGQHYHSMGSTRFAKTTVFVSLTLKVWRFQTWFGMKCMSRNETNLFMSLLKKLCYEKLVQSIRACAEIDTVMRTLRPPLTSGRARSCALTTTLRRFLSLFLSLARVGFVRVTADCVWPCFRPPFPAAAVPSVLSTPTCLSTLANALIWLKFAVTN